MERPHESGRTISLDEMLRASRDQFDRLFQDAGTRAPANGNGAAANGRGTTPAAGPSRAAAGNGAASSAARGAPANGSGAAARPRPAPATAPDRLGAAAASASPRSARPRRAPETALDPITLDLIENALRNARHEMDAVLFRSAMSPVIREQHDEFPMITDAAGRMIVGQFGSYIPEMLAEQAIEFAPGDIVLQSDPYKCGGAISHINDWMVLLPIFHRGELIGFSSMFGHMMDVGGPVPCSMPTAATSIFGEGLRIPPVKIYEGGELNRAALDIIMNNTRTPEMNLSDLMAIIAGCRAGERRVIEICERFGPDVYGRACTALLKRTERAMRQLIVRNLPEEPQTFEDFIDDDGCGNGPFRLKLTVWREGEDAWFDWTGTSPQAPGPVNFYLHEGMFKMFIGVYMIMVFDPQILFNDGFYDIIHVTLPKGSLLHPNFPPPSARGPTPSPGSSMCWAARSAGTRPRWPPRRGTDRVRTSSIPERMRGAVPSSSWRSSTAGSPAGRSATAWTGTRGGRCLRTSLPSTSRATTRCASRGTARSRIPAGRACIGAATGWRRSTGFSRKARSRSTTTVTSAGRGASSGEGRAPAPRSGSCAMTGAARSCPRKWTTCGWRRATGSSSGPRAEAAGAMPSSANRRSCAVTWCGGS